jgi:hypothetical protein
MKLELVREEKLYRLLPGKKKRRLEASGVALVDDATVLVVFDNLDQVARIDLSLEPRDTNRLLPAPSLGTGFEDIAVDRKGGRVLCLIEALEDVDGLFRGFVAEYDIAGRFVCCTRLSTEFKYENKGFEGLAHVRRGGREYLFALCEGNLGTNAKRGGGRIDAFTRAADGGWEPSHRIRLPKTAEFEDYAGMAYHEGRLAIVSQASARVWTARVDKKAHALVPGSEVVYRFPKKSYGNVEGIAWLSGDTLVAVSDKKKARQPERCGKKDQSIHVFRIPAGPDRKGVV